jgi:hypothetical protein
VPIDLPSRCSTHVAIVLHACGFLDLPSNTLLEPLLDFTLESTGNDDVILADVAVARNTAYLLFLVMISILVDASVDEVIGRCALSRLQNRLLAAQEVASRWSERESK